MVTFTSNGISIELPDPVTGNELESSVDRIYRESRGGTLNVLRVSTWPKSSTYKLQFENLTKTKRDEFFSFIKQTLGLTCVYIETDGTRHDGIITVPNGQSLEKNYDCGYVVEVQFET